MSRLNKIANPLGVDLSGTAKNTADLVSGAVVLAAAIISTTGIATGWGMAQMTAKGENDLKNVRNEYLDARLSADVAENEQKLKNEFKLKNKAPLKSMHLG